MSRQLYILKMSVWIVLSLDTATDIPTDDHALYDQTLVDPRTLCDCLGYSLFCLAPTVWLVQTGRDPDLP